MKALIHSNERLAATAIFLVRLVLGIVMFAHGAQKVLGLFGGKGLPDSVLGMHQAMSIPIPLAYLSAFTEFLGGIGLMLGVLTRFFAIAVFINMTVAVLVGHLAKGFFAPAGIEFPLTLAVIAMAIAVVGPGRLSVDHAIFANRETVI